MPDPGLGDGDSAERFYLLLLAALQDSLGQSDDDSTQSAAQALSTMELYYSRKLLPRPPDGPKIIESMGAARGTEYNERIWRSVVAMFATPDWADRLQRIVDRTLVRTVNRGHPSASTTRVGDEYLVVVDNSFHDFLYHFSKLLVFATHPISANAVEAPVPDNAAANDPLDTAARLLRITLGGLRWYGELWVPSRLLLPEHFVMHAIDFTERSHAFLLAHEAAHILWGHLDSNSNSMSVGGLMIGGSHGDHDAELLADLAAANAMLFGYIGATSENIAIVRQSGRLTFQAAHLLFAAIRLFEEAYYLTPPISHPRYEERLSKLLRFLTDVTDPVPEIPADEPLHIDLIGHPGLERLVDVAVRSPIRDSTYDSFLSDLRESPYFMTDHPGAPNSDFVDQVEFLEPLVNSTSIEISLNRLGLGFFPWIAPDSTPASVFDQLGSLDEVSEERLFIIAMAEIGRRIILGPLPGMRQIRGHWWSPPIGTPFYRWAQSIHKTFNDPGLSLPIIHISALVVRNGSRVLNICSTEMAAIIDQRLNLAQYPELAMDHS